MSNLNVPSRTIFCKDNIHVLRGFNSNSVDLIYLDPPFNKKKVFTAPVGSHAEGAAFSDIFRKDDIKDEWVSNIYFENVTLHTFLTHTKTDGISYNYCYLVYMAIRLLECKRILKDTGSLYLHCDPTMSHYLKVVMDSIFGESNFINEIVWKKYAGRKNNATKKFTTQNDIILFYAKDHSKKTFSSIFLSHSEKEIEKEYRYTDEKGERYRLSRGRNYQTKGEQKKIYLKDSPGRAINNLWVEDNLQLNTSSAERTGYPTQKPLALLERIINASSNKDDVVLDPFCGCATTCVAAERLERRWIGIDVSIKAFDLVRERLKREVPPNLFNSKDPTFTTVPPVRDKAITDAERGHVYVISNPAFPGAFKVGIAKDVKKRLNGYQTSDPNRGYKVEYSVFCTNYVDLEIATHNYFDGNRENEWVTADKKKIIAYIKKNAENVAK